MSNHFGSFLSPLFILPIIHDTRFTKTFRDYGLPSTGEFPLSGLAMRPEILDNSERKHQQVANALLMGDRQYIKISTPVGLAIVDRGSVDHIACAPDRARFANFVRPTLEEPTEIWFQYYPKHGEFRRRFIKLFKTPDGRKSNFFAVVQEDSNGNLLLTAFPAKANYIDGQRTGILLYGG